MKTSHFSSSIDTYFNLNSEKISFSQTANTMANPKVQKNFRNILYLVPLSVPGKYK